MGIKSEFGAYFLSPHFSSQLIPLITEKGFDTRNEDVVGLMVKIADEANGSLNDDGSITKPLTSWDLKLLTEGYDKAMEILTEIGVDPSSIVATPLRGAHPGGTAAMGKVVDRSLETRIKKSFHRRCQCYTPGTRTATHINHNLTVQKTG